MRRHARSTPSPRNTTRIFTNSAIGRAQRDSVWEAAARTFLPGSNILELNCGTGEDAFFLSRLGMSVYACDASENMIAVARRRQLREARYSAVEFNVLATENLSALDGFCREIRRCVLELWRSELPREICLRPVTVWPVW